ncbi:sigma-70 family RNA polymerase sigma factor [Candidatus Poribacteria bacterium]|nr:sigma-70 family RNA polymerase sigma factor [Candidatus Poribacteria bacterium]
MGMNDEELIDLCLAGDRNAFGELVVRYKRVVLGLAYRIIGNFEDAKDLSQETFIRAYTRLSQLRDKTKFASWLKTITFSLCMNWLKAQGRTDSALLAKEINQEELYDIPDPAPLPDEQMERQELREAVLKAINKLPETYRLPLMLYHFDGLSYYKVSEALDIPLSTVKWRLHQARRQLRKEMFEMKQPETRFEWLGLEFCVLGSPDSTRLFHAVGSNPAEAPISFSDAKMVLDQFTELTRTKPPVVKHVGFYPHYEPTAHPDFLSFWELMEKRSDEAGEDPEETYSVLSTNGYGIARADNYREMLQQLKHSGTKGISLPLHGLEEHHDWFAHRKGAFADVFLAAERAAEVGMGVYFNVWVDRQNIPHLSEITDIIGGLRDRVQSEVTQFMVLPRFIVTGKDEVRFYESELRPRLSDLEGLPSNLAPVEPPYDKYTESAWVERILANPAEPSFLKDGFDDVSDDEGCYILIIDQLFDVYREPYNFEWPPVKLGNLKTDGLPAILDRLEASQVPRIPNLATLAEKYGDSGSTLIHRYASSVRSKWLDMYWRERQ